MSQDSSPLCALADSCLHAALGFPPSDEDVEGVLEQLSDAEKVDLLSGKSMWESHGVPRLGIAPLRYSDGPHGVRGFCLQGEIGSTLLPCEVALAATFNESLISELGALIGAEAAHRGAHCLLGPTINMQRSPLFGRHFECFSEDPHLSGRAAAAYVRGVQEHVAACAKHFVCNDQENYRHTVMAVVDERALHEVYLAPFETLVREAGVESIMCGYNRVNGAYCAQSTLLTHTVRDVWGFEGFFVSDWFGNQSTEASLEAGLNVEMPGLEPRCYGGYLLGAVQRGTVSRELLTERCRPVLRTALRHHQVREPSAVPDDTPQRRQLLRRAALESLVLLKNSSALPLEPCFKKIAVIGPNAAKTTVQGGGSARVKPRQCATILQALKEALPEVEISHEPGCSAREPRHTTCEHYALQSMGGCDATGQPGSGLMDVQNFVVDNAFNVLAILSRQEWFRRGVMPALRVAGVRKADPAEVTSTTESEVSHEPLFGSCFGFRKTASSDAVQRAMSLARDADVSLVVVGTDGSWEAEGQDQPHMKLPGEQQDLIRCVAEASRGPVILIVNVGSPKELPVDCVHAALLTHFGGEEMGPAVVDVLLGTSPAGRLPYTWPRTLAESSAHAAAAQAGVAVLGGGEATYAEGLYVGYRGFSPGGAVAHTTPAFAFGHGLSYTAFRYTALKVSLLVGCVEGGPRATVEVEVENVGKCPGAEVVQLYAVTSTGPRALRGFARTAVLEVGSREVVTLDLGPRALGEWYNVETRRWQSPQSGDNVLLEVGASSVDVRSSFTLLLT